MTIARAVQPRVGQTAVLVLVCVALAAPLQAQTSAGRDSLRADVEAGYQVTPISGGVGLMPRDTDRGFALIQLRGGTVAIDGEPVSGQELVVRLGAAADLILRLTYFDRATQRSLFGLTAWRPLRSWNPPRRSRRSYQSSRSRRLSRSRRRWTGMSCAETSSPLADVNM